MQFEHMWHIQGLIQKNGEAEEPEKSIRAQEEEEKTFDRPIVAIVQ